mmetsp:Transcript_18239/g.29970  ORF Transcript_18239/g.29970 Transcript_18239/m.29970 type:complete len:527 (+) Transcript_18239:190-1770(+)|eukprot:CAMPEP_0184656722 /NCGR_PEP_ID=MMETSP0308-20130426/16706_1 /TAXON_ID=38269 /ORGANISM="Gloeochaete witrockiana, Strain SAG 46.84" /LENGTH=526 /DNA_ID=CAMNT_0027093973 /DNA_START=118 /DNA_END=1698 /DNA_ORIENTATION=-
MSENAENQPTALHHVGLLSMLRSRRGSLHASSSAIIASSSSVVLNDQLPTVSLPPISNRPPPSLAFSNPYLDNEKDNNDFHRVSLPRMDTSTRPQTFPFDTATPASKFAARVRFATAVSDSDSDDEELFSRKVDQRLSSSNSTLTSSSPLWDRTATSSIVPLDATVQYNHTEPHLRRSSLSLKGTAASPGSRPKSRQSIPIDIQEAIKWEDTKEVWIYNRIPAGALEIGRRLGEGGSAYVLKGKYKETIVAIKQYKPHLMDNTDRRAFYIEEIEREAHFLTLFSQPNISKCEGISWNGSIPSLVLEYLPGTSLNHYLHTHGKRFHSATQVLTVLIQIAGALEYMHTVHHTVHRDVKSLNIMLHEQKRTYHRAVLIDFGLCRTVPEDGNMTPKTGSYRWCAPEVLRGEAYGFTADVYSFSIVMWECISGRPPYYGLLADEVGELVASEGLRPRILLPSRLASQEICDLVHECWRENPQERPTSSRLLATLKTAYAAALEQEAGSVGVQQVVAVAARTVASSKMCLIM